MNRHLLLAVIITASSCVTSRPPVPPALAPGPLDKTAWINIGTPDGTAELLPLDDYVRGSVLAEANFAGLPPHEAELVAQVQALLARTYALANLERHLDDGFNLCSTTHCQVYRSVDSRPAGLVQLADKAVQTTKDLVISYNGAPINAVFHADCGGHTSNAQSVWRGATPPYLKAKVDSFCLLSASSQTWMFETDLSVLRAVLNRKSQTTVGNKLDAVIVTERDVAGRASFLTLYGEHIVVVRGEHFRSAMIPYFGPRSMRSTKFNVKRVGDAFTFEGRGFGHGVGLCQVGAMARARAGHSLRDILTHYYSGTTLAAYDHDSTGLYYH